MTDSISVQSGRATAADEPDRRDRAIIDGNTHYDRPLEFVPPGKGWIGGLWCGAPARTVARSSTGATAAGHASRNSGAGTPSGTGGRPASRSSTAGRLQCRCRNFPDWAGRFPDRLDRRHRFGHRHRINQFGHFPVGHRLRRRGEVQRLRFRFRDGVFHLRCRRFLRRGTRLQRHLHRHGFLLRNQRRQRWLGAGSDRIRQQSSSCHQEKGQRQCIHAGQPGIKVLSPLPEHRPPERRHMSRLPRQIRLNLSRHEHSSTHTPIQMQGNRDNFPSRPDPNQMIRAVSFQSTDAPLVHGRKWSQLSTFGKSDARSLWMAPSWRKAALLIKRY
jgi:hypothetical protein